MVEYIYFLLEEEGEGLLQGRNKQGRNVLTVGSGHASQKILRHFLHFKTMDFDFQMHEAYYSSSQNNQS